MNTTIETSLPDVSDFLIAQAVAQRDGYGHEDGAPFPVDHCDQCDGACARCREFKSGDRVELSPAGRMLMSKTIVVQGSVLGQIIRGTKVKHVVLLVSWDQCPDACIAKVEPRYLQHVMGERRAFV